MQCEVRLHGPQDILEELAKSFDDDPEIVLDDSTNQYNLRSSEFTDIEDAEVIREQSEELLQAIRGFGELDSLTTTNLEIAGVVKIDDDGSKYAYTKTEDTVAISDSVTVTVTSGDGKEQTVHPADQTYEWTTLALADDKVLELAELLDNGDSWVNLYRIYEFIQANIQDDDNIVEQGWWSASEKDLFKHTANSRDALGSDARHGDDIPAPEKPMSHAEAKRLIDKLVQEWLQHR